MSLPTKLRPRKLAEALAVIERLLAIIVEQQARIAELEGQVMALQAQVTALTEAAPGHAAQYRPLVPAEQVDAVVPVKPRQCCRCGARLRGSDPAPRRRKSCSISTTGDRRGGAAQSVSGHDRP